MEKLFNSLEVRAPDLMIDVGPPKSATGWKHFQQSFVDTFSVDFNVLVVYQPQNSEPSFCVVLVPLDLAHERSHSVPVRRHFHIFQGSFEKHKKSENCKQIRGGGIWLIISGQARLIWRSWHAKYIADHKVPFSKPYNNTGNLN